MLINVQVEAHCRISNSIAPHQLHDMSILGTRLTHKIEASRDIVEQVTHCYCCSMWTCTFATLHHFATSHHQPYGRLLSTSPLCLASPTEQRHFRNGRNA